MLILFQGIFYIDPQSLRRTTSSANAVAQAQAAAAAGGSSLGIQAAAAAGASEPVTMSTTASSLARAFGIVVRQIADLLTMLQDYSAVAPTPTLPRILEISYQESINLQLLIEYLMKPNWEWLMTVLDSTEAQLRFGSALAGATGMCNKCNVYF